jgi:hypothetical protein
MGLRRTNRDETLVGSALPPVCQPALDRPKPTSAAQKGGGRLKAQPHKELLLRELWPDLDGLFPAILRLLLIADGP